MYGKLYLDKMSSFGELGAVDTDFRVTHYYCILCLAEAQWIPTSLLSLYAVCPSLRIMLRVSWLTNHQFYSELSLPQSSCAKQIGVFSRDRRRHEMY